VRDWLDKFVLVCLSKLKGFTFFFFVFVEAYVSSLKNGRSGLLQAYFCCSALLLITLYECILFKGCMLSPKNCCEALSQMKCSLLALMAVRNVMLDKLATS